MQIMRLLFGGDLDLFWRRRVTVKAAQHCRMLIAYSAHVRNILRDNLTAMALPLIGLSSESPTFTVFKVIVKLIKRFTFTNNLKLFFSLANLVK